MMRVWKLIVDYGRMIKFSHTIFALPFALTSFVVSGREFPLTLSKFFWIVIAMAGARSAAMGFNRIVDARYDAKNPRTVNREIPRGVITQKQAWIFVVIASTALVLASYFLNPLCFILSPVALFFVLFYSLTKRFTATAHIFLGIALGIAPLGAWIAMSGQWDWTAFMLGCAVLTWVSGFDIIYACQDYEFDRSEGLFSIPGKFGIANALWISRFLHATAIFFLTYVGSHWELGWIYFAGVCIIATLLIYEQSLVHAHDLSKVNIAFMNMNGIISITYFVFTVLDIYL